VNLEPIAGQAGDLLKGERPNGHFPLRRFGDHSISPFSVGTRTWIHHVPAAGTQAIGLSLIVGFMKPEEIPCNHETAAKEHIERPWDGNGLAPAIGILGGPESGPP